MHCIVDGRMCNAQAAAAKALEESLAEFKASMKEASEPASALYIVVHESSIVIYTCSHMVIKANP